MWYYFVLVNYMLDLEIQILNTCLSQVNIFINLLDVIQI
jgi:hypothetical protein